MKTPRSSLLAFTGVALAIALAACSRQAAEAPTAQPPAAVEVMTLAPAELVESIDVVGNLSPKFQAGVKSEISGAVAEVYVTEWARVRKGAPLARIDTTEAEIMLHKAEAGVQAAKTGEATARANRETARAAGESAKAAVETAKSGLLEARVMADRADREYARLKSLREAGLATQQALEEAQTVRESAQARNATMQSQIASAEAQGKVAQAQLAVAEATIASAAAQTAVAEEDVLQARNRIGKAVVRAPFDGAVAERLVNVGEVVGEMQKVIFMLVDNRLLDLTFNIPSQQMQAVHVGQTLSFTTDAIPGKVFAGTVKYMNPAVDAADRSLRVTAEIRNADEELRGGLFVKGRIETGKRQGILLVPRSALLNWDMAALKAEILIVDGEIAHRRSVSTAAVQNDRVEIVEGLKAGDRFVVRGGFTLRDGDKVKATAVSGV